MFGNLMMLSLGY